MRHEYERVAFVLFNKVQLVFVSSRLAQSAQWYHSIPILSQTHLSETRSSPDSESAKPKKKVTSINPKTPCLFSQPDMIPCRESNLSFYW
jgi:hypothetical protein